jgi:hypothetical protein
VLGYYAIYYIEFLHKYLNSSRWSALEDSVKNAFKARANQLLSSRL